MHKQSLAPHSQSFVSLFAGIHLTAHQEKMKIFAWKLKFQKKFP